MLTTMLAHRVLTVALACCASVASSDDPSATTTGKLALKLNPKLTFGGNESLSIRAVDTAPAVYWVSTPVLPGDTIVVAGAGFAGSSVSLAGSGSGCLAAAAAAAAATATWAQSVKALLPNGVCHSIPPTQPTRSVSWRRSGAC